MTPEAGQAAGQARGFSEQQLGPGRIVLYKPKSGAICPALIQAVQNERNGNVRLFVFGEGGYTIEQNVQMGNGAGEWTWPERA